MFICSTPLASKVRCSISVLGNSSTSVIFQSPTPLRVRGGARGVHLQSRGVQHRFVGGAKGGAPPKVRGCEGGAAPVSEGAPPSCTPKYFTNQGALPNVASPKQHPPKLHQQMLHSRRLLWGHNGKDVKIVLQCVNK